MRPISRGSDPVEFTIRMHCPIGMQFAFDNGESALPFELQGIRCEASIHNASLLVKASGLPTLADAKKFYFALQRGIAALSLKQRVPITIPQHLREPEASQFWFMPGTTSCEERGWPSISISPLLIHNVEAWVYPEHEYVAIAESIRVVPTFTESLPEFVEELQQRASSAHGVALDETLLLAISGYAEARRSTQWVWSFLLAVMTLEMLAEFPSSNASTIDAVAVLKKEADQRYSKDKAVDLDRIKNCLGNAKQASKNAAVRELVWKYCQPGTPTSPAQPLFLDAADCRKKMRGVYDARSLYVHEGRVANPGKLGYQFGELHQIALNSLGHILSCLLPNE